MDWGFAKIQDHAGNVLTAACFAMICHHCGERYVEFFPNAKQENLFIGMIHAFQYMGIPTHIITDNMKSVVIRRDIEGKPVWQKDYEIFMRNLDFATKLCKPRHPFTKGKVERLVRFVKENFYNNEGAFNLVFTSNKTPSQWKENFKEADSLLGSLERIFDDAPVFNIRDESFRGKRLEIIALQAGIPYPPMAKGLAAF